MHPEAYRTQEVIDSGQEEKLELVVVDKGVTFRYHFLWILWFFTEYIILYPAFVTNIKNEHLYRSLKFSRNLIFNGHMVFHTSIC